MTTPAVWTIGALLQWTEQFFASKGVETPRLDAQVLLAHALGCSKATLYTRYGEDPGDEPRGRFRELVKRRVDGVPVAYLVSRKEFFLLSFAVTTEVLIPRPATEMVVLTVLDIIKSKPSAKVLDVGTGSGCIAISIAHRCPGVTVVATDNCEAALTVAQQNAQTHGVVGRITFHHGDLFSAIADDSKFDLIVSNPPYIPSADIATLDREVRDHEPRTALDGGPDGLNVINRIVAGAQAHLVAGGSMLVEVGIGQADTVGTRFQAAAFANVRVVKDADGVPRVVCGRSPI